MEQKLYWIKNSGDKKKLLPAEEYHKYSQLTINLISSEDDNDKEHVIHSKSDNIEIMISDEADQVVKKKFDSLKKGIKII